MNKKIILIIISILILIVVGLMWFFFYNKNCEPITQEDLISIRIAGDYEITTKGDGSMIICYE